MSVSRCLDVRIGDLPPEQWGAEIAKLPEVCPHPGECTVRSGCRAHVAEYFRMQWRIRQQHDRRKGAAYGED